MAPEPANGANQPYATASETHTGVVFTLGDLAYKIKKPVRLSALDFRSRENRRAMCQREVALNRRLAPDVYLGLADLYGPDGEVCDHMVVMRRLPAERSLAAYLDAGSATKRQLAEIARTMADFHADADRGAEIDEQGNADAVGARWESMLGQLDRFRGTVLAGETMDEITARARQFVAGRGSLFDRRIEQRRIVDGHGDLLASDVFLLDDGPRVLDCLEFDDQLRWIDGVDDVACLVMDLEYRGQAELAQSFIDSYLEFAGDDPPESLCAHYVAYRALVRTMTSCTRAEQLDGARADAEREQAVALAELARSRLRAAGPKLVLVGGSPGSGKSTLSDGLAARLGAHVVSSDQVRKELAGIEPTETATADYRDDLYRDEHTARTYRALLDRGAELLSMGEDVVLDASWAKAEHRDWAKETVEDAYAELVPLRCTASRKEANQRIRQRTESISDADEDVAEAIAADADPWPRAHRVSTEGTVEQSLDAAMAALARE